MRDAESTPSPPNGLVPDAATATKVAEAVLGPIYGEKKIKSEQPYIINLANGVWTVEGSVPKGARGGAFIIRISQKNAEVLDFGHYK